jgi:hypothetical protein
MLTFMENPIPSIHFTEDESEDDEDDEKTVKEELDALFSSNPPALEQNPRFSPFPSESPVTFYDKHLDEHLILKRIRLMPSLSKSLSGAVDETIKSLNDQGISIPSTIGGLMSRRARKDYLRMIEPMVDARSVAEFYRDFTANSCQSVASTLLLHPRADYWWSVSHWRAENDGRPGRQKRFSTQEYALRLAATPQHDFIPLSMLTLDEDTTATLQRVAKRFPQLATWDIYALSQDIERMLEDIEILASSAFFSSEIPLTSGCKRPPSVRGIPDASTTLWEIPPESYETDTANVTPLLAGEIVASTDVGSHLNAFSGLRRSARLRETFIVKNPMGVSPSANPKGGKKAGPGPALGRTERTVHLVVRPPSETVKRLHKYDKTHFPPAEQFVQHVNGSLICSAVYILILGLHAQAWAQSVRDDSTLIILHCGNFERICVRHRKSQTLYVSELISVQHCENPSYFKLQVGLYIAAIQDSIDRAAKQSGIEATDENVKRSNDEHLVSGESKKRILVEPIPTETNKRRKTDTVHTRMKANDEEYIDENDPGQHTEVCLYPV